MSGEELATTENTHEDLCLIPIGGEVCTCDEIKQARDATNPWADIMTTMQIERDEHAREHGMSRAAARVEAESLGHTQDCAAWIWADRGLPCDCGVADRTIDGELA